MYTQVTVSSRDDAHADGVRAWKKAMTLKQQDGREIGGKGESAMYHQELSAMTVYACDA